MNRRISWLGVTIVTLLYWFWESRAAGNIRVDLLVLYPALTATYLILLWRRYRWKAVLMIILLMALNFFFLTQSYSWFGKHPG